MNRGFRVVFGVPFEFWLRVCCEKSSILFCHGFHGQDPTKWIQMGESYGTCCGVLLGLPQHPYIPNQSADFPWFSIAIEAYFHDFPLLSEHNYYRWLQGIRCWCWILVGHIYPKWVVYETGWSHQPIVSYGLGVPSGTSMRCGSQWIIIDVTPCSIRMPFLWVPCAPVVELFDPLLRY